MRALRRQTTAPDLQNTALAAAAGFGVAGVGVAAALLSPSIAHALTTQHGRLYLWIAAFLLAAVAWYFGIAATKVPGFSVRAASVPIVVVIIADSVLPSIGGVLPHQVAWGLLGLGFGYSALLAGQVPAWLIAYAGLGIVLRLTTTFSGSAITSVGLVTAALLVMWLVASSLVEDGGVRKLMMYIAFGYWAITLLAFLVYLSHVSVGTMNPGTVEMPWQGGLKNIVTSGNFTGYGFINGQQGREASFVVCAYHFIAWRYERRRLHAILAVLAAALFVTGYGRVAIVGAVLGFAVLFLTDRLGTRGWKLAAATLLGAVVIGGTGLVSKFTDLSGRGGGVASAKLSGSSGHLSLWSQHLGLFLEQPLTGVGSKPSIAQDMEARFSPLLHDRNPETVTRLNGSGSRGEGGWTGLLAQQGAISGGALLALIALAISYCFSAFPSSNPGKIDMTLMRACIAASLIFYITDEVPFAIYSVTGYVLGQITMIGVVRAIRGRRAQLGSPGMVMASPRRPSHATPSRG